MACAYHGADIKFARSKSCRGVSPMGGQASASLRLLLAVCKGMSPFRPLCKPERAKACSASWHLKGLHMGSYALPKSRTGAFPMRIERFARCCPPSLLVLVGEQTLESLLVAHQW